MEYKTISSAVKEVQDRTVVGIAAVMGNIDTGSDRLFNGAFTKTLQERSSRVQYLWQHDASQPPIAVIQSIKEVGTADLPQTTLREFPDATGGLQVTREYLTTPRGDEVLRGIVSGAIKEMSFGYDPVKFDPEEVQTPDGKRLIRNLREVRLWDISDVNWGMNPATTASKAAVPFKDTGTADETAVWSAPGLGDFTNGTFEDLSNAEKRRIADHFAWTANMPTETFGDLKLPHHRAARNGVGPAVWRGVAAAMGALLGARGGVAIPDNERRGVYDHLVRHYAQFDKEPPEYKVVQFAYLANTFECDGELKVGRVLSANNLSRLKEALEILRDILSVAEPQDPEEAAALTARVLRKLALVERDPLLFC